MSDISMPPAAPAPVPKRHLFDNPALKLLLLLVGYAAVLPVALVVTKIWLDNFAGQDLGDVDPIYTVHQSIKGMGPAPQWLWAIALIPSGILFLALFKHPVSKVLILITLAPVSLGFAFLLFKYDPLNLLQVPQ